MLMFDFSQTNVFVSYGEIFTETLVFLSNFVVLFMNNLLQS